tara:strand:+ start:255 stop:452 length:198 start_codon:yes stop_codon:yes gene_type:complete
MSQEANIKLTAIQTDYKQHITNQKDLRDAALDRITQIRKEVNALHQEESKLELIAETLDTQSKLS